MLLFRSDILSPVNMKTRLQHDSGMVLAQDYLIRILHCIVLPQVNPERVGFYRVSYTTDLFSALTPALRDHTLSPRDRLGLQNDAFALVRSPATSPRHQSYYLPHRHCALPSHQPIGIMYIYLYMSEVCVCLLCRVFNWLPLAPH